MFFFRLFLFSCLFFSVIIVHTPTLAYNVVAQTGETVHVKCIYNAISKKLKYIVWLHNGNQLIVHDSSIQDDNTDRYYPILPLEKSSATLQIRNISFEDAGVYSCIIYFNRGKPAKYSTTLQVRGLPVIKMAITHATEDESVFSMCCTDSALYPNNTIIEWSVGDKTVSSNSTFASRSSHEAPSNYSLCSNVTFNSNRYHHGQLLKCSVIGGINSSGIILNIMYSPSVKLEGKRRHVIFADKNERVKISCIGEGNPKPQVYLEKKISANMWAKLHVEPFTTESNEDSCTIHIYTLGLFSKEDTGAFRCTAKNGVGSEVTSDDIRIEFKILQNVLQIILGNLPVFIMIFLVFVVPIIAISIRTIYKRLWHKYDVSVASKRTLNMMDAEVRRCSNENVPDVCRSLRPLPQPRGKTSCTYTKDNNGYQELWKDSLSTVGYESASYVGIDTTSCVVKYNTLEGP
ncbi:Cell adhesion molecule 3 [Holothuria leucospilota]|uniref:Cell adhesion molecule 3 n=1 Tax=Holothuria leucospilota TaxID=206669 RepID=A0A9Q1CKG8_HOLLE|nr:Cell adhesion molecule 3 [Holothuria leucospilota]